MFWVLPVAVALLAILTQGAILFASPFDRRLRLAIAAGELMLFEYLTLSRSLSLGVCCLVLAMALRRSRWTWIPIALLPLCDFLFGVLSAGLLVLQWRDRRLWGPGVALWLACGLAAALSIRPPADMAPALHSTDLATAVIEWIERLGVLLVPLQFKDAGRFAWNGAPPFHLGLLLGPAFLWFAWRQTARVPLHRALLMGFVGVTFLFSAAVYPLHTRHLSLAALWLIALKWREAEQGSAPDAAFRLWLCIGCAASLCVCAVSLAEPFDTAAIAAREIEVRGLQHEPWVAFHHSTAQGVAALTGMEFIRPELECTQSFVRWNHQDRVQTLAGWEAYLRDLSRRHGRFYLISDFAPADFPGHLAGLARRFAAVPAGYDGQAFHLYIVGGDQPDRHWRAPPCPPARRPLLAPAG